MHFYAETEDGVKPKHFVPMAKDPTRTRPSRVTDAKKAAKNGEIWYPSVTSILNIIDKPALVNWKVDKHLDHAFIMANQAEQAGFEVWKKAVKAQTSESMDAAPKAGTDIHKVLEDWLFVDNRAESSFHNTELKIIKNIESTLINRGIEPAFIRREDYFICKGYGYAGCADLVTPMWVIDYKSKQEAEKFKPGKMAYPEHSRQLAAYGRALCDGNFRAANIFICLENGEIDFHEHTEDELNNGWLDFLDCLSIFSRNTYEAGV